MRCARAQRHADCLPAQPVHGARSGAARRRRVNFTSAANAPPFHLACSARSQTSGFRPQIPCGCFANGHGFLVNLLEPSLRFVELLFGLGLSLRVAEVISREISSARARKSGVAFFANKYPPTPKITMKFQPAEHHTGGRILGRLPDCSRAFSCARTGGSEANAGDAAQPGQYDCRRS